VYNTGFTIIIHGPLANIALRLDEFNSALCAFYVILIIIIICTLMLTLKSPVSLWGGPFARHAVSY